MPQYEDLSREELIRRLSESDVARQDTNVRDRASRQGEEQLRLATDLDAMTRVHQLGTLFVREGNLEPLLGEIVDAAIAIAGADFGNIQLLDATSGDLRIAAQRGFPAWWLEYWSTVNAGQGTCGAALWRGERVLVEDVERSPLFVGTPALEIQRRAGVRAVQSTPLSGRAGEPLGMFSTHYKGPHRPDERALRLLDLLARQAADIIERAQAEQALRASEQRERERAEELATVLDVAPMPVFLVHDPKGTHITGNRAARELLRLLPGEEASLSAPVETRPRHFRAVKHGRDLTPEELPAQQAAHGITVRDFEFSLVFDNGTVRHMLGYGTPLPDRDGQPRGAVHLLVDITARKQAEEALRAAHRRKEEFIAILAHELRNPLAPLRTGLQLLALSGEDPAEVKQVSAMMGRQVDHLVRLVDDLLDVCRITLGKIKLHKELVDLCEVVGAAIEMAGPGCGRGARRLATSLPSHPLLVEGDRARLTQVIGNLLTNAVKFTAENGQIWLTIEEEQGEARISVRDDGAGIAPDQLGDVFDLFSQAEPAKGHGLGIGLALARDLVEQHGGRIEARSDGPGTGSELIVSLPLANEEPPERRAKAEHGTAANAGRRILVVDDNRDVATSTAMVLRHLGAKVRVAYDGATALTEFEADPPDVVLLDIGMPAMDGYEVARRMREQCQNRELLLIAMTGWGDEEAQERVRAAGFDHHLVKPTTTDSLRALLTR